MFSTRLENTIGELGELVNHALLPDRRMQVGVARNTQLFEVMLGMHCDVYDLRRWTRARATRHDIFRF